MFSSLLLETATCIMSATIKSMQKLIHISRMFCRGLEMKPAQQRLVIIGEKVLQMMK